MFRNIQEQIEITRLITKITKTKQIDEATEAYTEALKINANYLPLYEAIMEKAAKFHQMNFVKQIYLSAVGIKGMDVKALYLLAMKLGVHHRNRELVHYVFQTATNLKHVNKTDLVYVQALQSIDQLCKC